MGLAATFIGLAASWRTNKILEWHEDLASKLKNAHPPHIILETLHDIDGDGRLLRGELTPIVGIMTTYMKTEEFRDDETASVRPLSRLCVCWNKIMTLSI